jgi:5'-3' exonuclease
MGILNFYKWIKESYPSSFKKFYFDTYDHIYIDLNYLLHMSSYGTKTQNEIIERLSNMIESILSHCNPTKTVNLLTDGSCSIAKLLLQRKRRLTSMRTLSDKIKTEKDLETSELNFTPGTKFMNELEKKLENLIKKIEFIYKIEVKCILDSEDEAEIKIKRKLMENKINNPDDTHVVVTNDADVVVILSTLEYIHNVFIFFKDPKVGMQFLSISELLWEHTKKFGLTKNFGLDFGFISILMGNDYLPKINILSLEKVWMSYKININIHKKSLINNNLEVNSDLLIDILTDSIGLTKRYLISKCDIMESRKELYKNYLDGLMWCFNVYYTGKCERYNYMYEYSDSPNPLALILCINNRKDLLKINNIKSLPIEKNLYTILLIPKSAKILIDKKYYNFMNKKNLLYDEEECNECIKYYKNISDLNKELKKYDEKSEKYLELKSKINNISKNNNNHKKLHDPLCSSDIETIITEFNNYKKEI